MADDAKSAGLLKAGRFLLAEIKRRAPTAKSAESFRLETAGSDVVIASYDMGTIATDRAWRHPVFGDREVWAGPSKSQRGRKAFVERTADYAAQQAAEAFGDEWITVFTEQSDIWEADE